ncbi:MAG: hypothetical protein NC924_04435 [Candidatus Omnitrophica bacterium]|nr:hypothetical protein [Candidatus Omnitrophota bacterium]
MIFTILRKQLWGLGFLVFPAFSFAEPELTVSAIMFDKEPVAIVNGFFLQEGEQIDGCTLVEIGENYVMFRRGDTEFVRQMPGTRFRRKDAVSETGAASPPVETAAEAGSRRQEIVEAFRSALREAPQLADFQAERVARRFGVTPETVKNFFMEYVQQTRGVIRGPRPAAE